MNRSTRPGGFLPLAFLTLLAGAIMSETAQTATNPVVIEAKHKVRVERHVRVPMRDGTKLSADLIRPDTDGRFPAIIEALK